MTLKNKALGEKLTHCDVCENVKHQIINISLETFISGNTVESEVYRRTIQHTKSTCKLAYLYYISLLL